MPLKALKPCKKIGCAELTRNPYCDKHQQEKQEQHTENNRYYDKNKRDQKVTSFYKSKLWNGKNGVRNQRLMIDNYLCQHCFKDKKITKADMVHHIVEVKRDWSKRYELTNLISLCNSCHLKVEHYKG